MVVCTSDSTIYCTIYINSHQIYHTWTISPPPASDIKYHLMLEASSFNRPLARPSLSSATASADLIKPTQPRQNKGSNHHLTQCHVEIPRGTPKNRSNTESGGQQGYVYIYIYIYTAHSSLSSVRGATDATSVETQTALRQEIFTELSLFVWELGAWATRDHWHAMPDTGGSHHHHHGIPMQSTLDSRESSAPSWKRWKRSRVQTSV